MLTIVLPESEGWDPVKNEFISVKETRLTLEHSLMSLAKWESKWEKPYLDDKPKTAEEIYDYIRCMTVSNNVNPEVYNFLTEENLLDIQKYINAKMTATTINDVRSRPMKKDVITAEIIYYWMITLNIPFECQKWHLNRLLTLIRVCSIKNTPPKKMGRSATISQNRQLNAARRAKYNSRG